MAAIVKLERKDLGLSAVSIKELLESGVHFGHQTRRWNPRMKPYIFTERGGIYIIDLQKSIKLIDEAYDFIKDLASNGRKILFVGTKKQCQDTIKEEAVRAEMPYVSHRWLGGLLTNYSTISKRIKRLHELRRLNEEGRLELLPTREQMNLMAELAKLETNLGGVADMDRLPNAIFVVDIRREAIVIREARKLGIPIVALVDTNCDPDEIDYVIPGNDDAIRSCGVIIRAIAEAVVEGRQLLTEKELVARAAKEKQAAEEAAKKAAAKKEAEAKAETKPKAKTAAKKEAEAKPKAKAAPKSGAKGGEAKKAAAKPKKAAKKTESKKTGAAKKTDEKVAVAEETKSKEKSEESSEVESGD